MERPAVQFPACPRSPSGLFCTYVLYFRYSTRFLVPGRVLWLRCIILSLAYDFLRDFSAREGRSGDLLVMVFSPLGMPVHA